MDTDMLAAMEDVLDAWPGTLIVVSHDRYFLERVTDDQYGIVGGRLRHLPGGVDEFLRLDAEAQRQRADARRADAVGGSAGGRGSAHGAADASGAASGGLTGAERHAAEKEMASLERRAERLRAQAAEARTALAGLDQSDYERLAAEMARITALEDEAAGLEDRWLELSEQVG
jgi:ATPase subunit of ABC transporter with duplicated ATPase domains